MQDFNYMVARSRMEQFQAEREKQRQVEEARRANQKPAKNRNWLTRWFKPRYRPAPLSPDRRTEMIRQEFEVKA